MYAYHPDKDELALELGKRGAVYALFTRFLWSHSRSVSVAQSCQRCFVNVISGVRVNQSSPLSVSSGAPA